MKNLLAIISLVIMLTAPSCKSSSGVADGSGSVAYFEKAVVIGMPKSDSKELATSETKTLPKSDSKPRNIAVSGPVSLLPKATAFRMSGDYANNVAITLDSQGNLTYFPAPSDISPASAPVALAEGWWLNRQGIGINSVFTKYTFDEYAALPTVPTVAELKAAIIPGARVTEVVQLPFTIGEAADNIPAINEFIVNSL